VTLIETIITLGIISIISSIVLSSFYIDNHKNEYSLTNGPVEVNKGETGNESIIPVHWSDNTGPFIYVHTSDAYAETYTTGITWTLVDAP